MSTHSFLCLIHSLTMATRSALAAVLLSVGATAAIAVRAAARRHANLPETVAAAIDALIAQHWEWRMKANPELAAFFGEAPPKGASVLDDRSLRAYAALEAHAKHMLDRLAAVPAVKLPAKGGLRARVNRTVPGVLVFTSAGLSPIVACVCCVARGVCTSLVALRRRLFQEQLEGLQRGLRYVHPTHSLVSPSSCFCL